MPFFTTISATRLTDKGRVNEAIAAHRSAIKWKPDYAPAYINLGNVLRINGSIGEAIEVCRRAVELRPDAAAAHNNLGAALRESGSPEKAIDAFRRALQLMPNFAAIHNNLGLALDDTGRSNEAIDAYHRAIELKSDFAEAYHNLSNALHRAGRLDEMIAACRRAIGLKQDDSEAYINLGIALHGTSRLDEAITAFHRAIELKPESAEAYYNLGNTLYKERRTDESIAAFRRAIELRPGLAEAHLNLGNSLRDQGRLDDALASYRSAVAVKPDYAIAASNVLLTMHYHPAYDAQALLAEHRHWARQYAEPLAPQIRPHSNDRTPDRRLRIGFLSYDFWDHAVGQLLVPLFVHRDRRQAEFVCYSDVRRPDAVTEKLKALADQWHESVGMGDPQLADRIRDDRIDILVDLGLHTAGNRMLVFARKPAPVQVTMLGMPTTTGLAAIDYRLTDPYLDPPGSSDADYTEESIRLPHCFWVFQPPEELPTVNALPAAKNGFVTFGCLNQFAKVTRPASQLWMKILQSLPGSRLVLQAQPGSHQGAVHALFQEGGIAGERIEFTARSSRLEYFRRFQSVDLGLDPFPYNGHTSTLDALWMGVPVITLAGRTAVARGGVSILSNVGLTELIAQTPEQYVDIAVGMATDLGRLSKLRSALRERVQSSPPADTRKYAADVDIAFRRMWEKWCR